MKTTVWLRFFLGLLLTISAAFPAAALAQKIKVGYWTSGFSLGFGSVMEQMKFAEVNARAIISVFTR